jgi:type V secretory pathway adhesin AidA
MESDGRGRSGHIAEGSADGLAGFGTGMRSTSQGRFAHTRGWWTDVWAGAAAVNALLKAIADAIGAPACGMTSQ